MGTLPSMATLPTYYGDTCMHVHKVVATDPERMWAEDADVLTAKLEPGFMLQAHDLFITPRARLHAASPWLHLLWLYSLWLH